ncbi:MAG: hypothetical protein LBG80_02710 [Bacteroidales bacterium]|jgi:hypothetical protein|nr:hypothetical protein [Bacteroidales bacterium]
MNKATDRNPLIDFAQKLYLIYLDLEGYFIHPKYFLIERGNIKRKCLSLQLEK